MINIPQPNSDPAYLASQGLNKTAPKRFLRHLSEPNENGCILWTGSKNTKGYGQINTGIPPYRPTRAHRVSYILFNGPIPTDKGVLHKCPNKHNSLCVNPEHLSLGDQAENMQDMVKNGTCYLANIEHKKGSENQSSKLTQAQRDEIRALHLTGEYTQWGLARQFGVVQGTIWNVLNHIGG